MIIFKYRDWKDLNHKKILLNLELYFNKPSDFNDPFDCQITPNYKSLLNERNKQEFIYGEFCRFKQLPEMSTITWEYFKTKYEEHFEKPDYFFRECELNDLRFIDQRYGVASFSTIWNSILMWSHYGNKHQGFCVGFDEEKFIKSRKYMNGGLVQYKNEFPDIEPNNKYDIESLFKVTHNKAEHWKYEKEYRIVKLIKYENDRIDSFPKEFIHEIILGLEISNDDRKEILDFSKTNNIPLYQIIKKDREFRIERKKIF